MPEEDQIATLVAGLSFCPLSPAENQFPVASGCAGSPASSRVSVGYCSGVARCARFTKWTVEKKCYSDRCNKIFVPLKTRFGLQECFLVCLSCWSCSFELHEGSGECRRSI